MARGIRERRDGVRGGVDGVRSSVHGSPRSDSTRGNPHRSGSASGTVRGLRRGSAAAASSKRRGALRGVEQERARDRRDGKLRSRTPDTVHTAVQIAQAQRRRRIIRAAVLWVIVIAAAIGFGYAGISFIRSSIDDIEASTATPDPRDAFREIPCTPELVTATVKHSATYAGKPVDFSVSLTNSDAQRPCYLNAGYADMALKVTDRKSVV